MTFDKEQASILAAHIRKNILRAIASKGTGHVGGSLSITDALAVLYSGVMNIDPSDPDKPDRDILVLSKGHTGPALYGVLAEKGYFDKSLLDTLNKNDTHLPSHADRLKTPGVDVSTGSLGQGASLAAGSAFADRLDGKQNWTYLILGDGELDEGQVWESVLFAASRKLTHLITVIDANGKQLDGETDKVCCLGSIENKFEAFGYHVISVPDGSDVESIYQAFTEAHEDHGCPCAIVLHTKKGAGIRKYEEMDNCHSTSVKTDELPAFFEEIDTRLKEYLGG